jgi:hypothetical protein
VVKRVCSHLTGVEEETDMREEREKERERENK